MRVLLIDDDADVRMLATFVLKAAGHAVDVASSGHEGLAAASECTFDVVLLDYRLGDMSGADVLARLRQHDAGRLVVMLTGEENESVIRALSQAGAAGIIPKPFDPERLAGRLEEIVAGTV